MILNAITHGNDKPPLIILHGLFGSARNWQGIARLLAADYTVHALDLRNHGGSPHADEMTYELMAADVLEFMNQANIENTVLLGHSMGGKVAMELALSSPNKISRLIVVDIAPVEYQHNFDDVLVGLYHIPLDQVNSRKDADEYLAQKINSLSLRQFLLQNLVTNSEGGYQWKVNLASIEQNMPKIMGFPVQQETREFKAPSLFINGAKSTYLTSRYQPLVNELFLKVIFNTIADAGHWPHIEAPQPFMDALSNFLEPA